MVVDGEPYEVERTFKERWFSFPWRPFRKTKIVTPKVPDDRVVQMGDTLMMHPVVAKAFREQLQQQNAASQKLDRINSIFFNHPYV